MRHNTSKFPSVPMPAVVVDDDIVVVLLCIAAWNLVVSVMTLRGIHCDNCDDDNHSSKALTEMNYVPDPNRHFWPMSLFVTRHLVGTIGICKASTMKRISQMPKEERSKIPWPDGAYDEERCCRPPPLPLVGRHNPPKNGDTWTPVIEGLDFVCPL